MALRPGEIVGERHGRIRRERRKRKGEQKKKEKSFHKNSAIMSPQAELKFRSKFRSILKSTSNPDPRICLDFDPPSL
jgi:hypothetical protein